MRKNNDRITGGKEGSVLIVLIVAVLVLGSVGVIMSSLMSDSQQSIPRTLDSARAFSLVQGGTAYAGQYLKGVSDWSTLSGSLNKSLGTGTFTIQWGAYNAGPPKQITVTITGASGSAQRRVTTNFMKSGGAGAQAAIASEGNITISGASVNCNGYSSPCIQQNVSPSNMPVVSNPGGLSAPNLGCNPNSGAINAGAYYCSQFKIDNSKTITVSGPVTIICDSLRIHDGNFINSTGSPANLLIIVLSTLSDFHDNRRP